MISIAIPTSNMENKEGLFTRCLESLWMQVYQDFEIVVTDDSTDDGIQKVCDFYKTGIRYYRNTACMGMARNTNEAIKRSKGELIKILYMDDFLAHDRSLLKIVNNFDGKWLVTACTHIKSGENFTHSIHFPKYSDDIHTGNNTIGSPSVLTIKNINPLLFDENMTWLLDCDYYKRMYDKFGEPNIINDINVVIGLHDAQATHTMGEERKLQEFDYITKKYNV